MLSERALHREFREEDTRNSRRTQRPQRPERPSTPPHIGNFFFAVRVGASLNHEPRAHASPRSAPLRGTRRPTPPGHPEGLLGWPDSQAIRAADPPRGRRGHPSGSRGPAGARVAPKQRHCGVPEGLSRRSTAASHTTRSAHGRAGPPLGRRPGAASGHGRPAASTPRGTGRPGRAAGRGEWGGRGRSDSDESGAEAVADAFRVAHKQLEVRRDAAAPQGERLPAGIADGGGGGGGGRQTGMRHSEALLVWLE